MITAEDIFEELFGEFEDEFDNNPKDSNILEDGSILVSAKMKCDVFNNKHNNLIPNGTYEPIAGYIISKLGRITFSTWSFLSSNIKNNSTSEEISVLGSKRIDLSSLPIELPPGSLVTT